VTNEVHKLGEVLRTAREAKGVDLARVERDTKIRERYLGALEAGDYDDLPGSVYTRGFLRNYGSYLGLDPEYLVDLYRLETSSTTERPALPAPPRPLATRRSRAFVITPGLVAAALLTVLVGGFVAWIGYQFVTFARTPELRITEPAGNLSSYTELTITVRGITAPNASVTVSNMAENPTVTADESGSFEVTVRLVRGSNVMRLVANDPVTGRFSEVEERTILVVEDESSPPETALVVAVPADGSDVASPVAISGSASPGAAVEVAAEITEAAPLAFDVTTASGGPIEIPVTGPEPESASLTADASGAFAGTLELVPGEWRLTVTSGEGEPIVRTVSVAPPDGLAATLEITGGESYLLLEEDGTAVQELSGRNAQDGDVVELEADETLRIRVGNAGVVHISINGVSFGLMGDDAQVVEWRVTSTGG
jgi:cytoskeletal protein RodZ